MFIKKYKKIYVTVLSLLVIGVVVVFFLKDKQQLEIVFFDVGQGDSILIKTPSGNNILIDGGPDKTILNRMSEEMSFFDKKIDLMILTHPHADHLVGLNEVFSLYDIEQVMMTDVTHTSPVYSSWLELLEEFETPVEIINHAQIVNIGNVQLNILYPDFDFQDIDINNLNNTSVVIKVVYNKNSFLLMGDAEANVERVLIDSGFDLKSDVLKVGHHGSSNASSEEFLNIVNPRYAVISVGVDNNFGHPHGNVLKRLKRLEEIDVLRTDELGSIKMISDGQEISIFDFF